MQKYIDIIFGSYAGYFNYLVGEILRPSWHNYFWWLVAASLSIFVLEIFFPWRKNRAKIGNDFYLDLFYTFWNYFLFSLIAYNALSMVGVQLFKDFLGLFGIKNLVAIELESWPFWFKIGFIFIFRDLMQYFIHRMLHRFEWMWEFHKVHHSSTEMGFGALLRYHFMENIIYRSCEYIPLAMLGMGLTDFFIVHIVTLVLGQIGHANLYIPLGKLKYFLNGPQMHLWHHAKEFPASHPKGFNFGISLSVWDFIFKTNYWPKDDPNLEVGLPEADVLPSSFIGQMIRPFQRVFGRRG
jgi:sterol desaturase/sphingolipid hydroxylase (fatty acid hydroxylase superfamily)